MHYVIYYSAVGRSIADVYNQGVIFTSALCVLVNMLAEVGYRGYGPTYRATYSILYGECEGRKNFRIDAIFCSSLSHLYATPL